MKLLTLKSYFLLCFSALIVLAAFGQTTQAVTQGWVARYDGGGGGDYAKDIAVDSVGNVIVTGYAGVGDSKYVTVKYDSLGNQLWVASYNGPVVNGNDGAMAIAVDNADYVYVTGFSPGPGTNTDIATVKYNPVGTQQWATRYSTQGNDQGWDLVVDSSGNVYVTGMSNGSDCITIKYNSAGVQQWAMPYVNTGYAGIAIALNVTGSYVYVASATPTSPVSGLDCLTIQYNSAGVQQWAKTYGGPGPAAANADVLEDIAVDGSGNVCVTGESDSAVLGNKDCVTIKYDSGGNQMWVNRYDSGMPDRGEALILDSTANVYVTGATSGAGMGADYLTIMYNNAGVQQWASTYDGAGLDDYSHDIDMDNAGNIYITGESRRAPGNDYVTVMYDSSGTEVWSINYDAAGVWDNGQAIAVYDKDNIYVTGDSSDAVDRDYATVKYLQGGPGRVVKWEQLPDLSIFGIDIHAIQPFILADDFNCTTTGPITEITIWGSWRDDVLPLNGPNDVRFTLSIHKDIPDPDPCNPEDYSMPGGVEWIYNVEAGTYEVIIEADEIEEGWWRPDDPQGYMFPADTICWKYTFEIDPNAAFVQQGEPNAPIVYWLDVQAHPNGAFFGWKTSLEHWNDDAVWAIGIEPNMGPWQELRYPMGHERYGQSIDLAFRIVTDEEEEPNEPEPKWLQRPDLSDNGLDVMATEPLILADDFKCDKSTLITDITIWGSWKYDELPRGGPNDVWFTLSIHSDIPDPDPQNPENYSMPGEVLWLRDLMPSEVSIEAQDIDEGWYNPETQEYIFPGDHICWKYVFRIPQSAAFCQEGKPDEPIVYWLDVQAHPNDTTGNAQFGWKTSIDHWNDDAVWGMGLEPYPGPWQELRYPPMHPYYPNSIDLAFAIDGNIPCTEPNDPNLKYLQRPDLTETGIDIRFDNADGIQRTLADDFPCTSQGRITDVHLWCSWLEDIKGEVEIIHLSIHDDIPASQSPTGYSIPGTLLWEKDFTPAEFNETLEYTLPAGQYEWWWDPYIPVVNPMGDRQIWRYDIYIHWDDAFEQEGEPNDPKVYWLDAWVVLSPNSPLEAEMGWKTSRDHWNDAAVYDLGGGNWINLLHPIGHPYEQTNIDMAFAITTQPECMKITASGYPPGAIAGQGYVNWVAGGKPGCWCYEFQHLGDVDGKEQGTGPFAKRIASVDLNLFAPAYGKKRSQLVGGEICADLDHLDQGAGAFAKAVGSVDLGILATNYGKKTSQLDSSPYAADYNYWIIPQ